ncbi:hypothetical protein VTK73DRAFT_776 [Phialemonium thermophilum]|uniref:Uncharacterized protein n=1 Tax=Phialemonium thermophilum TaxID=223376 RepID=A0ABR3VUD1_9PEZI
MLRQKMSQLLDVIAPQAQGRVLDDQFHQPSAEHGAVAARLPAQSARQRSETAAMVLGVGGRSHPLIQIPAGRALEQIQVLVAEHVLIYLPSQHRQRLRVYRHRAVGRQVVIQFPSKAPLDPRSLPALAVVLSGQGHQVLVHAGDSGRVRPVFDGAQAEQGGDRSGVPGQQRLELGLFALASSRHDLRV